MPEKSTTTNLPAARSLPMRLRLSSTPCPEELLDHLFGRRAVTRIDDPDFLLPVPATSRYAAGIVSLSLVTNRGLYGVWSTTFPSGVSSASAELSMMLRALFRCLELLADIAHDTLAGGFQLFLLPVVLSVCGDITKPRPQAVPVLFIAQDNVVDGCLLVVGEEELFLGRCEVWGRK